MQTAPAPAESDAARCRKGESRNANVRETVPLQSSDTVSTEMVAQTARVAASIVYNSGERSLSCDVTTQRRQSRATVRPVNAGTRYQTA